MQLIFTILKWPTFKKEKEKKKKMKINKNNL